MQRKIDFHPMSCYSLFGCVSKIVFRKILTFVLKKTIINIFQVTFIYLIILTFQVLTISSVFSLLISNSVPLHLVFPFIPFVS